MPGREQSVTDLDGDPLVRKANGELFSLFLVERDSRCGDERLLLEEHSTVLGDRIEHPTEARPGFAMQ